ncbi:MAG: carbon-nitrogen hydrolase family protein [Planctomycetales bacterium]
MAKILRTATCQFPVEASLQKNLKHILHQIAESAEGKADVAHFSETCLTGYPGSDIPDLTVIDREELMDAMHQILAAAKKHKIWTLLGSSHFLTGNHKAHNSVYVIDPKGKIVDRYDKRFCTGVSGKKPTFDLCHYAPGNHNTIFKIKGITCAVLICYDFRFPELYRELKKQGVQVIFQSFHNARKTVVDDPSYNIWKTIVPATMACRAAENSFWISSNNSQARRSCWASFVVQPDGEITGQLKLHKAQVLFTDMDVGKEYFDPAKPWRERAMSGVLHSGELLTDPRSTDRTCI